MKYRIATVILFLSFATGAVAAPTGYETATLDRLIDSLTQIDSPVIGADGEVNYTGFIADDAPLRFGGGILGQPVPAVPPQMRELVRRGAAALPALISHLNDARPTKLRVERMDAFFGGSYFGREYDPKNEPSNFHFDGSVVRDFDGPYTVRVADLCYFLIGQIVGRDLNAVRYRPSAIIVVNSPLEAPWLAEQVRKDWGHTDTAGLQASLLADLHDDRPSESAAVDAERYWPALARLRLYFPTVFASFAGDDLTKRNAFEAAERKAKTND